MSMDPGSMAQMLAQQLQQGPSAGSAGGGAGGPQMQGQISPMNAGANLMQKVMLMKALQAQQQRAQQTQATGMLPGTQAQIQQDPTMQALQAPPPMDPTLMQQLQQGAPPMGPQ